MKMPVMRTFPVVVALFFFVAFLAPASSFAQELDCSPCSYGFGSVPIKVSSRYSIKLTNPGRETLSITSKSVRGSAFSFGTFPLPVKIAPGKSVELPLIFTPTAKGYIVGVFTLVSNAPNSPLGIRVHGEGVLGSAVASELTISPSTLAFGSVAVGSAASLRATLTASKAAVTVSSDHSTSSEFRIQGMTLPATLAAGQSLVVTIRFTPTASGTASAKAGFISNAANTPAVAEVTGTGLAQSSHSVDLFWDAATGGAVGYNLYRGTAEAGPFSQINSALNSSTTFTDSSVAAGATYYYVAAAVNAKGEESAYSNVAQAVIP
jgi:hypothetical protein